MMRSVPKKHMIKVFWRSYDMFVLCYFFPLLLCMLTDIFSHKVQKIKCTDHPRFPMRSLLMCRDSSVRIISPTSGDVITTLLQRPKRNLVDAAYAIAEGNMDVLK